MHVRSCIAQLNVYFGRQHELALHVSVSEMSVYCVAAEEVGFRCTLFERRSDGRGIRTVGGCRNAGPGKGV